MKLLYYYTNEQELRPGILTSKGVIDVEACLKERGQDHILKRNFTCDDWALLQSLEAAEQHLLDEETLSIASCVSKPSKIICIGLNYRKHAAESGMKIPEIPVVFTKYNNTLTGYGSDIVLGKVGKHFDYEVELGMVIGKTCKDVPAAKALEYVFGYCVANDLSCRDLQFRTSQWLMGKSLDQFLPLGKYLVTADEIKNPQSLQLSCWVNGELRQHSNTADMIFSVAEIIEDLSAHMTLEPGDLILTGTPEGVAMGMPTPAWLQPGDNVTVEIEGLGKSSNRMI